MSDGLDSYSRGSFKETLVNKCKIRNNYKLVPQFLHISNDKLDVKFFEYNRIFIIKLKIDRISVLNITKLFSESIPFCLMVLIFEFCQNREFQHTFDGFRILAKGRLYCVSKWLVTNICMHFLNQYQDKLIYTWERWQILSKHQYEHSTMYYHSSLNDTNCWNFSYKQLTSNHNASDLLQEVFLSLNIFRND